jgi:hypothetical protein
MLIPKYNICSNFSFHFLPWNIFPSFFERISFPSIAVVQSFLRKWFHYCFTEIFNIFLHRSERGWFSRCQNDPFCHVIPWKMVLHHRRRRRKKNRFVSNRRKKLRKMKSVHFDTVNPEWQRWMEENDDFLFPYFFVSLDILT